MKSAPLRLALSIISFTSAFSIDLILGHSGCGWKLVSYVKFTSAIRTPFPTTMRGLRSVSETGSEAQPVYWIPWSSRIESYTWRVRTSPLRPLSRIWLLAVRNTSTPCPAMLYAYSSGAENEGYPVYGFPARVNSRLATEMSALRVTEPSSERNPSQSYFSCASCIIRSPMKVTLTVSGAALNGFGKGMS